MMDIWMAACLAFVFSAMFEFIIVRYISRKETKATAKHDTPTYFEFYQKSDKVRQRIVHGFQKWLFYIFQEFKRGSIKDGLKLLESRLRQPQPWDIEPFHDFYTPNYQTQNRGYVPRLQKLGKQEHKCHNILQTENSASVPKRPLHDRIDHVSRWAFPLLFLCFSLIYWPVLLFGGTPPTIDKNWKELRR